ncbi:MAG: hypothetical protein FJ009_05845 [Chloroflexi bacterium]|nr:hypothetical protein [Chloroflexota bacterium]
MLTQYFAALTFRDDERALTRVQIIATLALHFAGLLAAAYLIQIPLWIAPLALLLLSIAPAILYRARGTFAAQTLAPLFFLYAMIAARFVFIRVFGGDVPGYFDYNAPDLRATLFRLEPWIVCALVYTLAIQVRVFALSLRGAIFATKQSPNSELGIASRKNARNDIILLALTLAIFVWAGALYIGHRAHGVTGTDPYAYTQMGVDLARRGTPLHRFPLFESVAPLNIAWSPIVHLGYHIPINPNGDAPTVWPTGGSFAFAIAYRLAGEPGLYLVNPVMSLLLLVATGWLAWELFHDSKDRTWIAALSIAILATSHTLFDWATVPMVDAQAALFSVLTVGLALRFAREPRLVFATMCGLALGAAYFVRHTQLLIVPAICVLLWTNRAPRGLRVRALVVAGLAALLVALPDLWYHHVIFGSWLTPESRELDLFSIASLAETVSAFNAGLFAAREFGWLLPFLFYGAYRLARARRVEFIALALWAFVLIGFHLLYPALRLRDLLPEFPPLVIVAAYGVVAFVRALFVVGDLSPVPGAQARTTNAKNLVAATGFIATLFLLLIRVWNVLPIPFGAPQNSYGYLTAAQRAAFDQIAALTPPNAVIGATMNDGAIDLYARRATFRPGEWSSAERAIFVDAMLRAHRRVFLLDDGAETSDTRRTLAARYALKQILVLDVPVFSRVDGTPGALWEVVE